MNNKNIEYPDITVKLSEGSGNSFDILNSVHREFVKNGIGENRWQEFRKEATSSNYDHLLQTCMKWVNVE